MSINQACKLLKKSRSTFYKVTKNQTLKKEKEKQLEEYILDFVKGPRELMSRIGGKKLYYLINKEAKRKAYKFGENKFFKVLKKNGLLVKRRKKNVFTTDSKMWHGQFEDLLKGKNINRPEQVWVSDITYFRTKDGFVYGHLVTDAYSKKLMGAVVTDNLKASSTLEALEMANQSRQYNESLIHHSDRGFQYLSSQYTDYLTEHNIEISVTQNGSPYDNPVAERINGILKDEFKLGGVLEDLEQAKRILSKAMKIYNDFRPHISNDMLTPNEMHQQREKPMKTWKKKLDLINKRDNNI